MVQLCIRLLISSTIFLKRSSLGHSYTIWFCNKNFGPGIGIFFRKMIKITCAWIVAPMIFSEGKIKIRKKFIRERSRSNPCILHIEPGKWCQIWEAISGDILDLEGCSFTKIKNNNVYFNLFTEHFRVDRAVFKLKMYFWRLSVCDWKLKIE